jgi:serine/threonine protein kinase
MIMELFEKTLGKEILEISKLQMKIYDNNQIWNMMRQLIRIFAKMQRMNILHRDVKPENIMIQIVDDKKNYKIIDLAYAIREG